MFSIATPTRNALPNLKRCVGSVRGQSGVGVEHLIQDASSTDGTSLWLSEQADLQWRSEPDGGMYDAINRAWERSRGSWLSWLNADEQYLPGTLAAVATIFAERPDVDVVFGDYIVVDRNGYPIAQRREIPFRRAYVVNGFLNSASCTLFFRRRLLERGMLRLDAQLRYAADAALMIRLYDSGVRILHVPRYLSLFGVDGTNLSTHPQRIAESDRLQRELGAFRSRLGRSLVMLGRRAERFAAGAYSRRSVRYKFAVDEVPRYQTIVSGALGGRYSLATTRGSACSVSMDD